MPIIRGENHRNKNKASFIQMGSLLLPYMYTKTLIFVFNIK